MRKIFKSYKPTIAWIFTGIILLLISNYFVFFGKTYFLRTLGGGIEAVSLMSFWYAGKSHDNIAIDGKMIKSSFLSLFPENKNVKRIASLTEWNSNVRIEDIESFEIVRLTKAEKQECIGWSKLHSFNKYLKFTMKGTLLCKYVYISIYTNRQIKEMIKVIQEKISYYDNLA